MFAFKMSEYEDGDPDIAKDISATETNKYRIPEYKMLSAATSPDVTRPSTEMKTLSNNESTYPDEDGVLIRGLFMEGARWDRAKKTLQDSFPMEMYSVNIV
jgi:hypothetical protein